MDKNQLSPVKKKLLAKRIEGYLTKQETVQTILHNDSVQPIPLSFAQQRLWFLHQIASNSTFLNRSHTYHLKGDLDIGALQKSLESIVSRHEIFRTKFKIIDGQPVQIVLPFSDIPFLFIDLEIYNSNAYSHEVQDLIFKEACKVFDLLEDPLLRVQFLKLSQQDYILQITMHHIVLDGLSQSIFHQELGMFYAQQINHKVEDIKPLTIQYKDYAKWEQDNPLKVSDELQTLWKKQLGAVPRLELIGEKKRPKISSYRGDRIPIRLSKKIWIELNDLCQAENATMFSVLMSIFQVLLYKYSEQDKIVVGTPTGNRLYPELGSIIGFFANTLVIYGDFSQNPRFLDVLKQIQDSIMHAFKYQEVPFQKLVETIHSERTLSAIPLVQAEFLYGTIFPSELTLINVDVRVDEVNTRTSQFDLTLALEHTKLGLEGFIEYSIDIFSKAEIHRISRSFSTLIKHIVTNPNERVQKLPLLRNKGNSYDTKTPKTAELSSISELCIHEMFEKQALATPDRIAITAESGSLTYGELNRRADLLASYLSEMGVDPETLVGVYMDRSVNLIVSMLGILKVGGGYVPIDPLNPPQRIELIAADTKMNIILTDEQLVENIPSHIEKIECLDTKWNEIAAGYKQGHARKINPQNIAYVIYTSGSTGKPKGVLVEHANIVRLFTQTKAWFHFSKDDVWTLFHSPGFDFSVWEIWGALLHGSRLVIVPYLTSRDPKLFLSMLIQENVTILNQTPTAFRQLAAVDVNMGQRLLPNLRYVIFGGEKLNPYELLPWINKYGYKNPQLVNMYGITEITVHTSYHLITRADLEQPWKSIIGRPIPDQQMYVLDRFLAPVPKGAKGELYVGGNGVVRGYLNHPALTASRFLPDPYSGVLGSRMYKSGDVVRSLTNGDLEYLGRKDKQVKVRGYRIELEEITHSILKHPLIQQAVVLLEESQNIQKLVAYIVSSNASLFSPGDIRNYLRHELPEYMVPQVFIRVDTLPITQNGKLDELALRGLINEVESEIEPVTYFNETENKIATIWQDVLRMKSIGLDDNFFDIGGHSLLAIQVYTILCNSLSLEVSLIDFFRYPTIRSFANYIKNGKENPQEGGQIGLGRTDPRMGLQDRRRRKQDFLSSIKKGED